MNTPSEQDGLSRRERQIMEALYRLGRASAVQIHEAIPNPPTQTAVRTHLAVLEEKGHIRHSRSGAKHIYEPVVSREEMAKSVIDGVVENFFGGSIEHVVATLISPEEPKLSDEQLDRLSQMIEQAKRQGR